MRKIEQIYIDGAFVSPHGVEWFDLYNPSSGEITGQVRLADEYDTRTAIAAAKRAFVEYSQSSKEERIGYLRRLYASLMDRQQELADAAIEEFGAPVSRANWAGQFAANSYLDAIETLESYQFVRRIGSAEVLMHPIGPVGLITPWNNNAGFISSKLSTALAAGCTSVIKPSEMSALQTQVVTRAIDEAGLPPGVVNIVTGRGEVVGGELTRNSDIAKISFTGSTEVGKVIMRASADTLKRVTLELGGKSPTLILDDADLSTAVPLAITSGFRNSGQACIAGTRILVPETRLPEVIALVRETVGRLKVGDLQDSGTTIGPVVSQRQYERVQGYIRLGIKEGATLIAGGEGHPDGLSGYFVKPTVFADVTNDMAIAREEIFGPVLCVMTYRSEAEAIAIANDTIYGLAAYVISPNKERAHTVATRLDTGRVAINGAPHEPLAPFGGTKQSGIGREYGTFGLEAFLEPKSILGWL